MPIADPNRVASQPAQPVHTKIALDITAVDFDQFSLYGTGKMIIYDKLNL